MEQLCSAEYVLLICDDHFYPQSKATDLFAAAYSGNTDIFDLLVQRFDLPPDQWTEVNLP